MASLAHSTAPGFPKPADDGGVAFEHLVAVRLGAPGRRRAFGGEQVLGAIGNAVQGAAVLPRCQLRVAVPGLRQGGFPQHGHHRVVGRAEALQPVEEVLRQLDRGHLPRPQQPAELGDAQPGEIAHPVLSERTAEKTKSGSSPLASVILRTFSARSSPLSIWRVTVGEVGFAEPVAVLRADRGGERLGERPRLERGESGSRGAGDQGAGPLDRGRRRRASAPGRRAQSPRRTRAGSYRTWWLPRSNRLHRSAGKVPRRARHDITASAPSGRIGSRGRRATA